MTQVLRRGLISGPPIDKILTPRQLDVFYQVIQGKSNKDAAKSLFLTEKAVKFHLTNIFKVLKVTNRYELMGLYRNY